MDLVETHLSRVYLDTEVVYKVYKAVAFDFLDLSSVERRRAACEAELTHNAPWAPGVYLGVVPVPAETSAPGALEGAPEHAVKMVRLPDSARLDVRIDTIEKADIVRVAAQIKTVHQTLAPRPLSAQPEQVRERIETNLDELLRLDHDWPASVTERLRTSLEGRLVEVADELEHRSASGQTLHGDLRAEHVYLMSDAVRVLDGVAFDPALAEGDPAEDVAFLVMDLTATLARWDMEEALWKNAGIQCSRALRDLYVAHRALIRAKVALLRGDRERARHRCIHALVRLEDSATRPALIGVGGLPGTGKSTLSASLAAVLGAEVVRTDVVRKRLGPSDYSDTGRTAVYTASLAEAERIVGAGGRAIVDASFERADWRRRFVELGRRCEVRPVLLLCEARARVVEERLRARVGDASDADVSVYRRACAVWEPPMPTEQLEVAAIPTDGGANEALGEAVEALATWGLTARK